eukprot:scaffold3886_cov399-Prasinococcus_capsulatus_cf.AAC.13
MRPCTTVLATYSIGADTLSSARADTLPPECTGVTSTDSVSTRATLRVVRSTLDPLFDGGAFCASVDLVRHLLDEVLVVVPIPFGFTRPRCELLVLSLLFLLGLLQPLESIFIMRGSIAHHFSQASLFLFLAELPHSVLLHRQGPSRPSFCLQPSGPGLTKTLGHKLSPQPERLHRRASPLWCASPPAFFSHPLVLSQHTCPLYQAPFYRTSAVCVPPRDLYLCLGFHLDQCLYRRSVPSPERACHPPCDRRCRGVRLGPSHVHLLSCHGRASARQALDCDCDCDDAQGWDFVLASAWLLSYRHAGAAVTHFCRLPFPFQPYGA